MSAASNCRLIGRWRIVEADLWDREYLDLCGPARLTITAQGGEIAFGALEAGLEVEYGRDSIGFRWSGSDEGDKSRARATPNFSTTAQSRSNSPIGMATRPSSKLNQTLLQHPARSGLPFFWPIACGRKS
jgi:hypothetical protein